jgi:hypothetical protein
VGQFLRQDGTWATAPSGLTLGTTSTTALAGNTTVISNAQAAAITTNSGKTSFPGFGTTAGAALEGNTTLLAIGTTSTTALAGDTTVITTTQATDITNSVKNDTDTYTSTPPVTKIITLTQAEYTAITTPDVNTLYIII